MSNDKILDEGYNKIIGKILKEKRERYGYSLSELAKKLNSKVTRQALSRYENNTARIKINLFCDICDLYGERPQDVIEEISLEYMRYIKSNENKIRKGDYDDR